MTRKQQKGFLYILAAVFLLALPTYSSHYRGVAGKLLVASPGVPPPFNQTVVFIAQHSLSGAWGIVVNRPFAWKTGKGRKQLPAYFGGPVECPKHDVSRKGDDSLQIAENGDAPATTARDTRSVIGCAGWGLFQLNIELATGAWSVIDYDPALVFDTPPDKMWDAAHDRALQDAVTKEKNLLEQYLHKK
jgi:putative transcriptional regulator